MIGILNDKCDFCGTCVAVCPVDSITLYEARIVINNECNDCMLCVWICPIEALAPIENRLLQNSDAEMSSFPELASGLRMKIRLSD